MKYSLVALGALVSFSSSSAFINSSSRHPHVRAFVSTSSSFSEQILSKSTCLYATLEETASSGSDLDENILSRITDATQESKQWAEDFDLASESGAAFYALFSGIRSSAALGLKGKPFYLKSEDILKAMDDSGSDSGGAFDGFFTFDDLIKALEEDFLDADRGSTDNRKGWKVSDDIVLFIDWLHVRMVDCHCFYGTVCVMYRSKCYVNRKFESATLILALTILLSTITVHRNQGRTRINTSRFFIRRCTHDTR